MNEREETRVYYVKKLEKETKYLADLLGKLHNRSRRLWSLMIFFYEYGFKKFNTTPEERTLRSIADSFNKDQINKFEEISVNAEDMEFLLVIIRQMIKISYIVDEIGDAGYNVKIASDKWHFAGCYFY